MSEVKRYDPDFDAQQIYEIGEVVSAADFDRVTAERDAALALIKTHEDCMAHVLEREKELQQRLTAADERADLLETALAGMLFAFDDGVGRDWSEDLLDFARKLTTAKEFNTPLKPAEPATDEHVCTGCGAKGWTANCSECVPY